MRTGLMAALAALALGGCGGSNDEDFAVAMNRPLPTVFAALGTAEIPPDALGAFPELKVVKTRPSEHEVVYTIPGDAGKPAVIHFKLESIDGGQSTMVHTAVDVPRIKIVLNGREKVLSEWLVERMIRRILENSAESMAMGSDRISNGEMQSVLLALAIGTNKKLIKELEQNPKALAARLPALGERFWDSVMSDYDAEHPDTPDGDRADGVEAKADVDPERDAANAQAADLPDTSEERDAVDRAAKADDVSGDSAAGDTADGES